MILTVTEMELCFFKVSQTCIVTFPTKSGIQFSAIVILEMGTYFISSVKRVSKVFIFNYRKRQVTTNYQVMLFDDLSQDCNAAEQCKMTILYFMVHFC